MYKTLGQHEVEQIIKKSRFIALSQNVTTEKEAKDFVESVRQKYYDARHIAYAYRLSDNEQIYQKSSDDGEPSGTAGKPILNLILNENLMNVCICVVRYFGGIKLGAGGLTRAYGNTASMLREYFVNLQKEITIETTINNADRLLKYLDVHNLVYKKQFLDKLTVSVFVDNVENLKKDLDYVDFIVDK